MVQARRSARRQSRAAGRRRGRTGLRPLRHRSGTGTDAAPYFRAFNPVTQSEKFDAAGKFIRRWVPELGEVPDEWIHAPWESGPLELLGYGVELGKDYPEPIVDHGMARQRAIDVYEAARASR